MLIAIIQVLLTAAASYGVWRAWRALGGRGVASHIITAGFLVRAICAQLLFWISWLRLPVARSLQTGDGFWFFGLDATWYLGYARELDARGLKAILFSATNYPSHIFTQAFALATLAFGVVASTGILFNCAAYLAICALILRVAPPESERARLFALAAIAFGPATILWSFQPLKDTFFALLIAIMIAASHGWQVIWRDVTVRKVAMLFCAAAMTFAVYALAGTRWYVSGTFLCGSLLFFVLVILGLPRLRIAATLAAAVLFFIFGQAFRIGGDYDVPIPVRQALDFRAVVQPRNETKQVKEFLAMTRRGFDSTPGATAITPGAALAPEKQEVRTTAAVLPPSMTTTAAPATIALPRKSVSIAATDLSPAASAPPPVVATPAINVANQTAPPPVATATSRTATSSPTSTTTSTTTSTPVVVATPATDTVAAAAPAPATVIETKPAPQTPVVVAKKVAKAAPKVSAPAVTTPAPAAVVIATKPAKLKVPAATPPPQQQPHHSVNFTAIVSGAASMFLPRAIAQPLGLVRIGGGRGFWFFADADTLVFDAVILFAFGFSLRQLWRRELRITPLFIFVALTFIVLVGPLVYTVTNFGTMFRLRQILYVLAAMLPITLDLRERAR